MTRGPSRRKMTKLGLVELCAGTAAVSLAALGAPGFPASRRGSKRGWVGPILEALKCVPPIQHVVLVESDPHMARLLKALFSGKVAAIADAIEERSSTPARAEWERARAGSSPDDILLTIAGSRGGVRDGGFKGAHCLRASVDGFTPNRRALAARVRAFESFRGRATVVCCDAAALDPTEFAPSRVYVDPPYAGRRGYGSTLTSPESLARRWADAGHYVVVSEAVPLPGANATKEITHLRSGQARRSLTNDQAEWISIFGNELPRTAGRSPDSARGYSMRGSPQQHLPF